MSNAISKRLLDANEVCAYLNLGRCKGVEFAKSIDADVKIGRRVLFDKNKIDRFLDTKTTEIQKEK